MPYYGLLRDGGSLLIKFLRERENFPFSVPVDRERKWRTVNMLKFTIRVNVCPHRMEREMVEGFVNGSMNLDFLDYVLNRTLEDKEKYEWSLRRYQTNLFIEGWMLYLLILLYGLLITFGTVGNCLTVIAVVRKAAMRTPRNM